MSLRNFFTKKRRPMATASEAGSDEISSLLNPQPIMELSMFPSMSMFTSMDAQDTRAVLLLEDMFGTISQATDEVGETALSGMPFPGLYDQVLSPCRSWCALHQYVTCGSVDVDAWDGTWNPYEPHPVYKVIIHLNDQHQLPRTWIADWLDTLEDLELTAILVPQPEVTDDDIIHLG